MTNQPDDPEQVARALHARDASAAMFGIELVRADTDGATVTMLVRPDMCNGYGMVHGGITFLLADSAMAFASCTTGETALATAASISWLASVDAGRRMTAVARRQASAGRTSIWDITVTVEADHDTAGATVAVFRGTTRQVGTPVVP